MMRFSTRVKIVIGILLCGITVLVANGIRPMAISGAGAVVVAVLMVAGVSALAAAIIALSIGFWRIGRPRRLYLEAGSRLSARLARAGGALLLLVVAGWAAYFVSITIGAGWMLVLLFAAAIIIPMIYWRARRRIENARIGAPGPPTKIRALLIPIDHPELETLSGYEEWVITRKDPLQTVALYVDEVLAWHFPFPDYEIYEAFSEKRSRGDRQLLSVGKMGSISQTQSQRLTERTANHRLPSALLQFDSLDLADTLFAETTGDGYLEDFEVVNYELEKLLLELRQHLPEDQFLVMTGHIPYLYVIFGSEAKLEQLRKIQNEMATMQRQTLREHPEILAAAKEEYTP